MVAHVVWDHEEKFDSYIPDHGQVAQLVEQRIENPCASGSIPLLTTIW